MEEYDSLKKAQIISDLMLEDGASVTVYEECWYSEKTRDCNGRGHDENIETNYYDNNEDDDDEEQYKSMQKV